MNSSITSASILQLQTDSLLRWKSGDENLNQQGLQQLVEENHHFNYQLWMAEDKARRDDQGFEYVYRAKRQIDHFNQQRNNRMEAMDEWFTVHLQPATDAACPVHSETPGMMIDRLSILALKVYHMHQQTLRTEAGTEHISLCQRKLDVLLQQQKQLAQCLQQLIEEVEQKKRTFRVYHQFKMYNDPKLNPQLYTQNS